MTVRIYTRLSPRPDGKYEGVEDQEKWGRDYADRTWPGTPVKVYADEGISAAKSDRPPDLERLLEDIRTGTDGPTTGLWTVEQSRFERGDEVRWFEFARILTDAGITEVHTNRDGVIRFRDTTSAIRAILSIGERRRMLERQADRLAEIAAKGEPPGVRPFGYVHATKDDGTRTYAVMEEQAEAIRFAAEKVLAGWSLASIAADLDRRGVRGTHGGKVVSGTVRTWLTSPSIAAKRVHSGQVVGKGNWPPILDAATFKAVGSRLRGARTVQRADGGTYDVTKAHRQPKPGRRYLLTGGLAVCGVCEAPLVGSMKQIRGKSKPYLLCHPKSYRLATDEHGQVKYDEDGKPVKVPGKACLGIMLDEVEEHVLRELWARLDSPEFLDALADDDDHEEARARLVTLLEGIDGQRQELAGMWGRRELTTAEWQAAKAEVGEQERQANADLAALPATSSTLADIEAARENWDEGTLDEQRAFIRRHVAKVTILRATRHGRPGLDTDRVKIEYVIR